ncbi:MAG: glycosyltransferase family 2 protein [Pseudoclavibacter sp.]
MTVSVVVKTLNRPRFLHSALADIARQTHLPDEVVVVNDGGDPQAVHKAAEDSNLSVRIIDLAETGGRAHAANVGVTNASGEYLVIHDDDDSWDPEFLAVTTEWLDTHPDDEGVVVRTNIVYDRLNEDGSLTELSQAPFERDLHEVTLADLLRVNRFVPISFLYRRDAHRTYGLFDESLPVVEDWAFHMKLARNRPIPIIPGRPLASWHQRLDTTGDAGNSVVVSHEAHRRFDLLKRDAALREDPSGVGGLLYLTRFLDDRFHDMHERFDRQGKQVTELESQIGRLQKELTDESWLSFIRRKLRRR